MLAHGGNDYYLPRVKRIYFPDGVFPTSLICAENTYEEAAKALKST